MRVSKIGDFITQVFDALANRLTAQDNFGPEGEKGQVLTSNGPRDVDPPPSYQNIVDVLRAAVAVIPGGISSIPGLKGDKGDKGDPGESGGGGVPLEIAADDTFTVPTNIQMTYAVPMFVSGSLVVDGALTYVD